VPQSARTWHEWAATARSSVANAHGRILAWLTTVIVGVGGTRGTGHGGACRRRADEVDQHGPEHDKPAHHAPAIGQPTRSWTS
jgi:hypothetical protein